jgi:glucokinase
MLYGTVSTGIGAGFVLNGALYRGVDGAAGEVGHMTIVPGGPYCGCGNQGCLEAVSSGTAIARQGREVLARDASRTLAEMAAGDPESVTAEMVAEAARSADREAGRIIAEAMDYLGIGIANLVNIFNPDLVVIGGGLTKMGAALFDPVRSGIRRRSVPVAAQRVQVVLAELGDRVGVIGAAAIAMEASAAVGQMGE